jgi:siroheme decarboxylase
MAYAIDTLKRHPGVLSVVERDQKLNLWFTLAVAAPHDLEGHLKRLEELLQPLKQRVFTPISSYKGMTYQSSRPKGFDPIKTLTPFEVKLLRTLQGEFPLTDEPFARIALELGTTEAQVFDTIRSFIQQGYFKRIAATLKSRKRVVFTPYSVAWQIPEERQEKICREIALFNEVTNCTSRRSYPDFPYGVFTTIVASDTVELTNILERLQSKIGKWPHMMLTAKKEHKNLTGLKYIQPELNAWWERTKIVKEVGV